MAEGNLRSRLKSFKQALGAWNRKIAFTLSLWASSGFLVAADLLMPEDIGPVTQKILSVHILYNHLDESLFAKVIDNYFQTFDPLKLYLLQSEIDGYTHASSDFFKEQLEKFQQQDYALFEELDRVIQKSILRARQWNKQGLPGVSLAEGERFELAAMRPKSISGLKHRWQQFWHIKNEQEKEGYREWLTENENEYLGKDPQNKPVDQQKSQHLFALHILKAIAASLDAHTAVFSAREAKNLRERLEQSYTGVGIFFENQGGRLVVKQIAKGSPADQSGHIQPGDELVMIGEKSVVGDKEALEKMQGKPGDTLHLGFLRQKALYKIDLKLAQITVEGQRVQVHARPYPGGGIIGYLSMDTFYADNDDKGPCSERDVKEAIGQLQRQGELKALVLDFRNNMGGFLDQAVKVVGLFIKTGVVAIAKYSDGSMNYFRDIDPFKIYDGPILVMTSRLSASAAEIVAGALHDYGLALVMGDHGTFGKGSIQMQTLMDPHSSAFYKVTVGRYYTVSGDSTQLRGVPIDFIVPGPLDQQRIGEQYEKAHLSMDKISPAFKDPLKDVATKDRVWFVQNYLPSLQAQSLYWKPYLSRLRESSANRVEAFFKQEPYHQRTGEELLNFQLEEAFEIAKEMAQIRLQAK